MNHEDVREVEKFLQETGDVQPWIEKMEHSQLKESEGFSAVLLMQGEQVVASTKDGVNYFFPEQEEIVGEIYDEFDKVETTVEIQTGKGC